MHCAYSNFDTMSFPDQKPPILKNGAYFSVEPFVLNGVNARGSNLIKPSHKKSVLEKNDSVSPKHSLFYKIQHTFLTFLKMCLQSGVK